MSYLIRIKQPFFQNALESISEISKDTTNNEILCLSEKEIYNFDKICQNYVQANKLIRTPCSNDGLYISNENICFIEFKNGKLETLKKFYDLLEKNYESLLILFDLELEKEITSFQNTLSYTKTKMDYILVYNEEKNPKRFAREHLAAKSNISSNMENILLELKNYLFRNVKLLSLNEFEREVLPNLN